MLLLDRAGWHTTGNLVWPRNITPILLPSRSPELNPVEQVWQYLRATISPISNRAFERYDGIIDAAYSDEAGQGFRSITGHPFQFHSGRDSDLKPATFLDHLGRC